MFTNKPLTVATIDSAGHELQCTEDFRLLGGDMKVVNTGITATIPRGYVALIKPKSGLAAKHRIDVLAGVCDSDYKGEYKVCLINHGEDTVYFKAGQSIAQVIILQYHRFDNANVIENERVGGFGSTNQ